MSVLVPESPSKGNVDSLAQKRLQTLCNAESSVSRWGGGRWRRVNEPHITVIIEAVQIDRRDHTIRKRSPTRTWTRCACTKRVCLSHYPQSYSSIIFSIAFEYESGS